jgi:hypothetical protein
MSLYEKALEEWKKRDPYLLDAEGFEKFLKEKENEQRLIHDVADAYWERNRYCERKLFDIAVRAVLESEFNFPPKTWEDFFEIAHRYETFTRWRGYNPAFDAWGQAIAKDFGVKIGRIESKRIWRRVVKHPEWYRDWDSAVGYHGYSGSAYYLTALLAICVKLGKEKEASQVLNNLPVELRYLGDIPNRIRKGVIEQSWRKIYDVCKNCTETNCKECLEAP